MADTRTTVWLRWPDLVEGPLWIGAHLNRRADRTSLVGIEVWTEPPGSARTSLGPDADGSEDLLPWPPTALTTGDLRQVKLGPVRTALRTLLPPETLSNVRTPLYGDDHYRRVAGAYERAVREGSLSPTLDVAQQWGVARSTAAKWVMRARRDRLITAKAPRSAR